MLFPGMWRLSVRYPWPDPGYAVLIKNLCKMEPRNKLLLSGMVLMMLFLSVNAQRRHAEESKFMTYKGMVMAGYQGWFNCEGDGADRGWTHYLTTLSMVSKVCHLKVVVETWVMTW